MGYRTCSLSEVDPVELDGVEPTLLSVGYHLRPDEARPNVWRFDPRESTNDHRHDAQEEPYAVLEGRFEVSVEDDEGGPDEFELAEGDYAVVDPDTWREPTAVEESVLLVVGAPPVEGDAEVR